MHQAIIEQVEAIADQENCVFDKEDWTVVPGRADQHTNLLPHMAGVDNNPQDTFQHPPSMQMHSQGSVSDLELGHTDYSDSKGDISQNEDSYHNEIADANEWVLENDSDEENGSGSSDNKGDKDESVAKGDADDDEQERGGDDQNAQYNFHPRTGRNYAY